MTEGDLELLQVIVSWAITLPGVAAIVVLDERRLRGRERERAWPAVSRDAAIFASWQLGLLLFLVPLVHFVRTRRSPIGLVVGISWGLLLFAVDYCAQVALAIAVDLLGL